MQYMFLKKENYRIGMETLKLENLKTFDSMHIENKVGYCTNLQSICEKRIYLYKIKKEYVFLSK